MLETTEFQNSRPFTVQSNVKCHPYHYNAMRLKPTYPQALIENNVSSIKPFPNNWIRTYDEWKYFKQEKQFRMRTLFNLDEKFRNIHLRSIDSLTNRHLLPKSLSPEEDTIYQTLGRKRILLDKRNGIPEISPGDKSYKAVEYAPRYFNKYTHNRDPIKIDRKKSVVTDLTVLLNIRPTSTITLKNELDFDYDASKNEQEEINNVRYLDDWKAAAPLKAPFKVLDPEDKTFKYRPKVTK